jgi:hypothetical protein
MKHVIVLTGHLVYAWFKHVERRFHALARKRHVTDAHTDHVENRVADRRRR